MVAELEDRLSVLDGLLDEIEPSDELAHDLFSVVDALDGSAVLRRVLTDPGTPENARAAFARGELRFAADEFEQALSAAAHTDWVVYAKATGGWKSP